MFRLLPSKFQLLQLHFSYVKRNNFILCQFMRVSVAEVSKSTALMFHPSSLFAIVLSIWHLYSFSRPLWSISFLLVPVAFGSSFTQACITYSLDYYKDPIIPCLIYVYIYIKLLRAGLNRYLIKVLCTFQIPL